MAASWRVLAYDRRGFGQSPPGDGAFRHLDDLIAVLDATGEGPVWLVGSSMGGARARRGTRAARPVAGLVLLAPSVNGSPGPAELDPATQRLSDLLEAVPPADLHEQNRLET